MSNESREESISAYIDNELPPEERAEVERWLAESPELRQLHDELRSLSGSLQALERHKLDRDLTAGVLRRAEQSVLRGAEAARPRVSPLETAASWWSRGAGWRRLVWPAVAVAAALLVVLYDGTRHEEDRQLAQAPQHDASPAGSKVAAPAQAMPQSSLSAPADSFAVDKEAPAAAAPPVALGAPAESVEGVRPQAPAARMAKQAAEMPTPEAAPFDAGERGAARDQKNGVAGAPQNRAVMPQEAPRDRPSDPGASEPGYVDKRGGGMVGRLENKAQQPQNEIEVQVTSDYLQSRAFDRMLKEQNIVFASSPPDRMQRQVKAARNEKDQAAVQQQDCVTYQVNANPQQLENVLGELKKNGTLNGRGSELSLYYLRGRAQQSVRSAQAGVTIIKLCAPAVAGAAAGAPAAESQAPPQK